MPSPDEIRDTVKRYAKLMCESDIDGLLALYAEDGTAEDPVGGAVQRGSEALRAFYAGTAPRLQVSITGPICVAGNTCAFPMLAEFSNDDKKFYLDVIDVLCFDDAGKVASMKAYWSPAEMRLEP